MSAPNHILHALTSDARALANGEVVPAMPLSAAETEGARRFHICNVCS